MAQHGWHAVLYEGWAEGLDKPPVPISAPLYAAHLLNPYRLHSTLEAIARRVWGESGWRVKLDPWALIPQYAVRKSDGACIVIM